MKDSFAAKHRYDQLRTLPARGWGLGGGRIAGRKTLPHAVFWVCYSDDTYMEIIGNLFHFLVTRADTQ